MAGGGRPKFTPDQRAAMAAAYADGESLRGVAERFGCSRSTVAAACKAAGVTREDNLAKVQAATETARERNARNRETAQSEAIEKALRMLQRTTETYKVHAFVSGPEGAEFMSRDLDEPPAPDAKHFASAAQTLIKAALDLARYESESAGETQAKAMIETLAAGLVAMAGDVDVPSPGEGIA